MTSPVLDAPTRSQLARRWRVDVNVGTRTSPTWAQVRGINNLAPKTPATLQDDSDYDNDGWGSQAKTIMNWSLEITVIVRAIEGGARDPGQAVIEDASTEFDDDGIVHCRWYERDGGPRAYEGFAQAAWDEAGGGVDALATANATLTGMGRRVKITNPAAA